jgi:membrane protease YdiL (CAAX protease family)
VHAIGVISGVFLLYMLVLLPWVAFRSASVFNAPRATDRRADVMDAAAPTPVPSRARIYTHSLAALAPLFALAWLTARTVDYHLFAFPRAGVKELAAGAGALLFQFGMMGVNLGVRSRDEIRDMAVNRLMPRTARERLLYSACSIAAGIAEEAAYRGVLMSILWLALGNPWLTVFISATAFALAHALQGWKSMLVIFVMACSMHALAWYTGTLVVAMAVHAVYDLVAPTILRKTSPAPPRDPERIAG